MSINANWLGPARIPFLVFTPALARWTIGTVRQDLNNANDTAHLLPAMARNVQITLLTPTLMALGIWLT